MLQKIFTDIMVSFLSFFTNFTCHLMKSAFLGRKGKRTLKSWLSKQPTFSYKG